MLDPCVVLDVRVSPANRSVVYVWFAPPPLLALGVWETFNGMYQGIQIDLLIIGHLTFSQ